MKRFPFFRPAVLLASVLVLPSLARAAPLITEFMASNQTGLLDEDGDRPDWIELHNPDLVPLDLGGYGLTDDVARPGRWRIPAGTVLPPGGYLVIFASNKDRAVAGQPLHTNFSLSAGGEYLGLTAPGGGAALSEWNPYPPQGGDVSYGLLSPTVGAASVFFAVPTPGAANDAGGAQADRVVFTPPSSTFANGTPVNVALSIPSATGTIRYTVNRSRPIDVNGVSGTFSANAATDVCTWAGHPLSANDPVRVSGPAPLTATGNYFVILLGPDTFKLSMEPGGPPIDLTGNGSFPVRRDAVIATGSTTDLFSTTVAHGFFSGDTVQMVSTGAIPGGVQADTTYFVSVSGATSFRISTSPTLTPIVDITAASTGVMTVFRTPSPVYAGPIPVNVNTRIRARAFEPGRRPGPPGSEMYFALDANARNLTSPLPLVVTHSWNTALADNVVVEGQVMV
ncbi:MAG: lamin tail domain-containing protein, partial [Verrucomicrobiota bacterium]